LVVSCSPIEQFDAQTNNEISELISSPEHSVTELEITGVHLTYDYSGDAVYLVASVEAVHPMFTLDEVPSGYWAARSEYLESTSASLDLRVFRLETQKYLASLNDTHTGISTPLSDFFLECEFVSIDGDLHIISNGRITFDRVISIGTADIDLVKQQVDAYYPYVNDAARQNNYAIYCRQHEMIRLAGYEAEVLSISC